MLQNQLDLWVNVVNTSTKRYDRHKLLPQGSPDILYTTPEMKGFKDYRIPVPDSILMQLAPKDDDVFALLTEPVLSVCDEVYKAMNSPVITMDNGWDIHNEMVRRIDLLVDHEGI
jgi:hypothetical protein